MRETYTKTDLWFDRQASKVAKVWEILKREKIFSRDERLHCFNGQSTEQQQVDHLHSSLQAEREY